jgi:hypothetical protein
MPYFDMPANSHNEMTPRRREGKRRNRRSEGEMVKGDPSRNIGQYCTAIFVDRQEEVTPRCKGKSCDIFSMRKRESMRLIAAVC